MPCYWFRYESTSLLNMVHWNVGVILWWPTMWPAFSGLPGAIVLLDKLKLHLPRPPSRLALDAYYSPPSPFSVINTLERAGETRTPDQVLERFGFSSPFGLSLGFYYYSLFIRPSIECSTTCVPSKFVESLKCNYMQNTSPSFIFSIHPLQLLEISI